MRKKSSSSKPSRKSDSVRLQPRFRIMVGDEIGLGPGKAKLLEGLGRTGSISDAARQMEMSYMRAWGLIRTMNHCFQEPLVETTRGGRAKGGAHLTPAGKKVLRLYGAIQKRSLQASKAEWGFLKKLVRAQQTTQRARYI